MRIATWRAALTALCATLAFAGVAAGARPARAQIEVDVNRGDIQPLPIAVPYFAGEQGGDIAKVIANNLERSGLFRPIDPNAFIERDLSVNVTPRFDDWKAISAQALVNGQVTVEPGGRLRVDFRLWDVYAGQQLLGLQFTSTPENWRRVAHKISDAVYERLTGEKGYFDTRVVFVAESGGRINRVKRLAIMDQDGANPSYLTDGSSIVMTPRFSSTSQEITYMALRPEGSTIYLFNLETARRESLGAFQGMVYAPRFSPDGGKVAFSVERGGNSDIYVMDLNGENLRRITQDPAVDDSPAWSPDGRRLAFVSERDGNREVYLCDSSGGNLQRITDNPAVDDHPVWSPDGLRIAFESNRGGNMDVYVVAVDGTGLQQITFCYSLIIS